jgi:c(7)-type cytochrome triheme protein
MNRLPLIVAAAFLAAGCGVKPVQDYATKEPAYVFPHSPHVENDVACTNCHSEIAKASRLEAGVRHVKIPDHPSKDDACSGCHESDPKVTPPRRTAPFRLTFDHAAHLPRVKGDCKACHKALPDKGDAVAKAPPMASCTACHNHQQDFAQARCTPCHVDLKGYKPEVAFAHKGDWLRVHGQLAHPSAETCAQCHDQTYCAECHAAATTAARPEVIYPERVDRAFIHRGDFVSRHMIEARASPATCRRCHGSAFCDSCHIQQNVSDSVRLSGGTPRRPESHNAPGFFAEHGHMARRDITSCAGCHDQGSKAICVTCHNDFSGTPAFGGNPHPKSFLDKHKGEIDPVTHRPTIKNSMCTACHTQ